MPMALGTYPATGHALARGVAAGLSVDTTTGSGTDLRVVARRDVAGRPALASGTDLRAEILNIHHRGSRYSLPGFLSAVAPRIAIVRVGASNAYGHPSKNTLDTLVGVGALVRAHRR
jgi:hypothetical protein